MNVSARRITMETRVKVTVNTQAHANRIKKEALERWHPLARLGDLCIHRHIPRYPHVPAAL